MKNWVESSIRLSIKRITDNTWLFNPLIFYCSVDKVNRDTVAIEVRGYTRNDPVLEFKVFMETKYERC